MNLEAYYILMIMGGASAFFLVFSLWTIALLVFYIRRGIQVQRMEERLGLAEPAGYDHHRVLRLWREGEYVSTVVPYRSLRGRIRLRMEQLRDALGWSVPLGVIAMGTVGAGVLAFFVITMVTGSFVIGVGAAVGTVLIPFMVAKHRLKKQAERFESQLADALALAARSLRAGHPLEGAFRLIGEELDPPVSTVFSEIVQQQALGLGMEEAIRRTAERSSSEDFDLFASSVVIQLRGGGNLAEMFERLSEVVRGRIRLHRRAKVLTAQTQLSKRILIAIPLVLFAGLYLTNAAYIEPLYTTTTGNILLAVAFVMLLLGSWVMNRIAQLRF